MTGSSEKFCSEAYLSKNGKLPDRAWKIWMCGPRRWAPSNNLSSNIAQRKDDLEKFAGTSSAWPSVAGRQFQIFQMNFIV